MEKIMSKTNDAERTRELTEAELDPVSGGGAFLANSSHTSISEAAEALKAVAQK
jgi:hypothetical protein